jgi:predicted DNA-binding transcriptional regulator AlpA
MQQSLLASSDKPLLSRQGIASLLGISLPTLDAIRRDPKRRFPTPAIRIGKILRWREADIQTWLTKELTPISINTNKET